MVCDANSQKARHGLAIVSGESVYPLDGNGERPRQIRSETAAAPKLKVDCNLERRALPCTNRLAIRSGEQNSR